MSTAHNHHEHADENATKAEDLTGSKDMGDEHRAITHALLAIFHELRAHNMDRDGK